MPKTEPQTLLTIEPSEETPRNSEGDIMELDDGRLLLAYSRFTGGAADASTAHIAGRISADGGQTWSGDRTLVETEGEMNVMSVSLRRLPSGEVLLFYMVKNGWDDCRLYVRRSGDELKTLGEPTCVTPERIYHVINNDRIARLSSGRLLAPAALHPCEDGTRETWSGRATAACYYSDDDGRTWTRSSGVVAMPDDVETSTGMQEPGVIELADGRVYMWARTDLGCQYQAFSGDGGETWSDADPAPLISPRSPASIKRVPSSGDLLAVWNDHSGRHAYPEGRRTPLCAALSSDEAKSWGPSRVIEPDPDGWYCYTSITFVGDAALLAYCAGDREVGGLNRLKVTRLPRAWIDRPEPERGAKA